MMRIICHWMFEFRWSNYVAQDYLSINDRAPGGWRGWHKTGRLSSKIDIPERRFLPSPSYSLFPIFLLCWSFWWPQHKRLLFFNCFVLQSTNSGHAKSAEAPTLAHIVISIEKHVRPCTPSRSSAPFLFWKQVCMKFQVATCDIRCVPSRFILQVLGLDYEQRCDDDFTRKKDRDHNFDTLFGCQPCP